MQDIAIGRTKLFMRESVRVRLDQLRDNALLRAALRLQARRRRRRRRPVHWLTSHGQSWARQNIVRRMYRQMKQLHDACVLAVSGWLAGWR